VYDVPAHPRRFLLIRLLLAGSGFRTSGSPGLLSLGLFDGHFGLRGLLSLGFFDGHFGLPGLLSLGFFDGHFWFRGLLRLGLFDGHFGLPGLLSLGFFDGHFGLRGLLRLGFFDGPGRRVIVAGRFRGLFRSPGPIGLPARPRAARRVRRLLGHGRLFFSLLTLLGMFFVHFPALLIRTPLPVTIRASAG